MPQRFARVAAWGVLFGLLTLGALILALRHGPHEASVIETVAREVRIAVAPQRLVSGATTTLQVTARDGEDGVVSAWEGARPSVWLVRSDLTYAEHASAAEGATSTFSASVRPTQPGTYRAVALGEKSGAVTIGSASLAVTGAALDVPPHEQSADRAGFSIVASTIPDSGKVKANEPVSVTLRVARTGTPIALGESGGTRGSLVAFRENGTMFVRGEPLPVALLPSVATAAFGLSFPEAGRYRLFFEFEAAGATYLHAVWVDVAA